VEELPLGGALKRVQPDMLFDETYPSRRLRGISGLDPCDRGQGIKAAKGSYNKGSYNLVTSDFSSSALGTLY